MFIYLKTKLFEYREQKNVIRRFYSNEAFAQIDQELLHRYRGKNPYQICSSFLRKKGETQVHAYGETPLSTVDKIVNECSLSAEDRLIELGCGRGRVALFLAHFHGMNVVGYEQIPEFLNLMPKSTKLRVIDRDFLTADFANCSAIYLYGTMLEDNKIISLCKKFPRQTKIITVTYPLSDYDGNYLTKKSFSATFAWGNTEVYLNERIS